MHVPKQENLSVNWDWVNFKHYNYASSRSECHAVHAVQDLVHLDLRMLGLKMTKTLL